VHRDDLESLLYFNPEQTRVINEIEKTIADWGTPEISTDGDLLKLSLSSGPDIQALYALDGIDGQLQLAGLVIFTRSNEESLDLLHMAVTKGYSAKGAHSGEKLALNMLCRVREVARRLRGVQQIILHYRGGLAIPVQLNRDRFLSKAEEML
jgi:hypothetical protein